MQEKSILIKNARIVNEGKIIEGDVLIENQFITEISESISAKNGDTQVIDAENKFLLPRGHILFNCKISYMRSHRLYMP